MGCPGCKMNRIVCKEYWANTCVYGHAHKSDRAACFRLFCEYGRDCKLSQCAKQHEFAGTNLHQVKCPWECGQSVCWIHERNLCPYLHDGQIGPNGAKKWERNEAAYGAQ